MTFKFYKNKNLLIITAVLLLMLAFAVNPLFYTQITLDGITIWALTILPSVFFYFVLTALLTSVFNGYKFATALSPLSRKLFNTSGLCFYGLIISALAGYPTGSKVTASLYENRLISLDDAIKMSGLTSTSGILFILSTIGNMLGRKNAVFILLAHFLSVILTAFIMSGKRKKQTFSPTSFPKVHNDNLLYNAIYDSVISVLVLGGIITFYYVLSEMLFSTGAMYLPMKVLSLIFKDEQTAKGVLSGLLECISGIKKLSMTNCAYKTALTGGILSFGGLSVITQSVIFLKKAKIKTAQFILSKIIQAVICFIILFVLTILKVL